MEYKKVQVRIKTVFQQTASSKYYFQIKSKFPLDEQEIGEEETLRMRLCMYLFELQMEGWF